MSSMGGPTMTIRRTITSNIPTDDDDDDDDGIPPEILELMKMTESMMRPSPFGSMFGSPMIRMGSAKPEEKIVRQDESAADIMARMNALSEEIGERKNKEKYEFVDQRGERLMQVAVLGLFLLFLVIGSFIVACTKSEEDKSEKDGVVNKGITTRKVRAE